MYRLDGVYTSPFTYGDILDQFKMYRGKVCVEKFVKQMKDEVKRLYATYPQQLMTDLTDVMKLQHEAAEKCHICFKEFNEPENRKVREINAIARVCIVVQPTTIAT